MRGCTESCMRGAAQGAACEGLRKELWRSKRSAACSAISGFLLATGATAQTQPRRGTLLMLDK